MNKINDIQEKLKASVSKSVDYFKKNQVMGGVIAGIVVILLIIAIIIVPKIGKSAKNSEIQSVVMGPFTSEKLHYIPYGEAEATIANEKAISVLFVDLSDKNYEKLEKVLADDKQMARYKNNLYIYPIVQKNQAIEKQFKLTEKTTLVFFENNQEVNRLNLNEKFDYKKELVSELNGLPMANSKEIKSSSQTPPNNSTDSSMGNESVILNNGTEDSSQ